MTGRPGPAAAIAAELARLRRLEQSLRAERERIRAEAAGEVARLQAALRESAARAEERERELRRVQAQLRRGAGTVGFPRLRRGVRGRRGAGTDGALERVLATFERQRRELEERARAVAQTELRQRAVDEELRARAGDGAEGGGPTPSHRLRAADEKIAALEQQLRDHDETKAALAAARAELASLARVEEERREAEAALLAARARLGAEAGEGERETEARIAALLARREQELELRARDELDRRRAELELEAEEELEHRRRALPSREQALRAEIAAREAELASREQAVARREVQLSLVRRRIGDEERRLQERAWRSGGPGGPEPVVAAAAAGAGEVTFSEGWRRLARPREGGDGTW